MQKRLREDEISLRLPRATSTVTVINVADQPSPSVVDQRGGNRPADTIYYVALGDNTRLQGTQNELQEYFAQMGLELANASRDAMDEQIQTERRIRALRYRRLA